ncbi:MAG: hypothetical protein ABW208_20250 [Pyrinomonadaceae bacterium]
MTRTPRSQIPPDFAKNVFINCSFDDKYQVLFRAIIFTVHDMRFRARCALEASNTGQVRIDKIQDIIADCKYSIHDTSRTQLDREHRLPRFNMPLELGLDLGCKRFGKDHQQEKVILVMDVERFRYQKFISDIAGQDIYAHGGRQAQVINVVREWLRPELDPRTVLSRAAKEFLSGLELLRETCPQSAPGFNGM